MSNGMTDVLDDVAERLAKAKPTNLEVDQLLLHATGHGVPLVADELVKQIVSQFNWLEWLIENSRETLADVSKKRT